MTVLVVDDDAVVAEYCRRILSEAGHSVLVVRSGKDALAALEGHEIDVVLSDVRMPGMDGVVKWTPLSRPFFARNKLMPTGSGF